LRRIKLIYGWSSKLGAIVYMRSCTQKSLGDLMAYLDDNTIIQSITKKEVSFNVSKKSFQENVEMLWNKPDIRNHMYELSDYNNSLLIEKHIK
jgi:hypothetical protein